MSAGTVSPKQVARDMAIGFSSDLKAAVQNVATLAPRASYVGVITAGSREDGLQVWTITLQFREGA
jgi:hypothetical protein